MVKEVQADVRAISVLWLFKKLPGQKRVSIFHRNLFLNLAKDPIQSELQSSMRNRLDIGN